MADSTLVRIFRGEASDETPEPLWYWHAKAANGEIVVASHAGSDSEVDARLQLEDLVDALWDNVEPEYFEDDAGEWRWRVVTQDATLRGRSSEGFADRGNAQDNFELAKTMLTRRVDVQYG